MSGKMKLQKQIIDDIVMIAISGNINEDSDFSEILEIKSQRYVFDFADVSMLNSCGIREWISFIDKLDDHVEIIYRNCPQIVIEQIGMVYGFIRKGAKIESFYAPYFCSKCDEEEKVLLKSIDIRDAKAPSYRCSKCNELMEFDEIEDQYFSFLKR